MQMITTSWWRWIILAVLGLLVLFIPLPAGAASPTERTFRIEASRFEYTPAILQVNPGDHVTIELVATDVVHGLSIDGYDLQTTSDPGQTARISFTADKSGTFRFHCTVTCGNMHPFMTGKLQVGQNTFLLRSLAFLGLAIFAGLWLVKK
jgi:heme/copper-type cytochrome/quinol oxidase subunit 2